MNAMKNTQNTIYMITFLSTTKISELNQKARHLGYTSDLGAICNQKEVNTMSQMSGMGTRYHQFLCRTSLS